MHLLRHAQQQLRPQQGCSALIAAAAILQRQLTTSCSSSSSSSSSSTLCGRTGTALQQSCHQTPQGLAAWGRLQHCSTSLLMRPSDRTASISSSSSSSIAGGRMSSASSESAIEREAARLEESRRARMRKAVQHEFRSPTLGLLWDKYVRRQPDIWQAGVLPHPIKTFRYLKEWAKGRAATQMTVASASRNIPGHNESSLVDTIAGMYRRISEAQASYKLDLVRDLMSKDEFRRLHLLMVRRQQGGWDKIDWRLEEPDKLADNIRLVQARLIKSSQDSPLEWLQFTYRISSKQRFAAYSLANKQVQLVAGDPDKVLDAEDYWVFEYKSRAPVNKQKQQEPGARWRLVGRLEDIV